MAENKRHWDPWKMYDVSPEEMRAINERAKMREALKAEWTKKHTNPWKGSQSGGFLLDPAVQRFIALKATQYEYFRGTFRSILMATAIVVLPVGLIAYRVKKNKEKQERQFRNGEIPYKDRYRFV